MRRWFSWWSRWRHPPSDEQLKQQFQEIRQRLPVPLFWLLGKTQSGKTSVIRYLTGATDAEIGQGFRATTRFSRIYYFPSEATPLLAFLDTRGLEEPDYDPSEDLAKFHEQAHAVLVTVRITDQALERLLTVVRKVRAARPARPILLLVTCLHEAYPGQSHIEPYPFGTAAEQESVPAPVRRLLDAHRQAFAGLVDAIVPIDFTPAEEGFADPYYGGSALKEALLRWLPEVYRQPLIQLDSAQKILRAAHERSALPYIIAYSSLAAAAAALPVPWVDLLVLPAIQTRMVYHLAELYGQPLTGQRFRELAATLGIGLLVRQAIRELAKLIPGVGSVVAATLAASTTYALGRAFCYYYAAVLQGHIPDAEEIRRYYHEELRLAEKLWRTSRFPSNESSPQ